MLTKDLDSILDRPVTASEVSRWPLVHGNLRLNVVVDSIRTEGLRAPGPAGQAANSFDYDRVLGRTDSVFLSLARLQGGYGLGEVVIVDPVVLSLPGVRCSLYDVSEVVRQMGHFADDPGHSLPKWFLEPQILKALVEEHRQRTEHRAKSIGVPPDLRPLWVAHNTRQSVSNSQEFFDYAGKYLMEPDVFLAVWVERHSDAVPSVRAFLERKDLFHAEVLVPRAIEPRYLLGYRSRGVWHPWRSPASQEAAERVDTLVSLWASKVS